MRYLMVFLLASLSSLAAAEEPAPKLMFECKAEYSVSITSLGTEHEVSVHQVQTHTFGLVHNSYWTTDGFLKPTEDATEAQIRAHWAERHYTYRENPYNEDSYERNAFLYVDIGKPMQYWEMHSPGGCRSTYAPLEGIELSCSNGGKALWFDSKTMRFNMTETLDWSSGYFDDKPWPTSQVYYGSCKQVKELSWEP